jgi:mycothiol synthase
MTASASPSAPDQAGPPHFAPWTHEFLTGLIARATLADGQPPFSDQSLVDLESGVRQLVVLAAREKPAAAAIVLFGSTSFEAEFVVDPLERHHGLGNRMMIEMLREAHGTVRIWAHGDHPDARALAKRYDMEPVRELLQLRAEVAGAGSDEGAGEGVSIRPRAAYSTTEDTAGPASTTEDTTEGTAGPASTTEDTTEDTADWTIDGFRVGADDAEWLAVNARAFATHPEQGKLTQADLDARIAEAWFDPEDFLVARSPDGAMMGFCWLKVDRSVPATDATAEPGEFYAVGVHPKYQGMGLGRALVAAGLRRLVETGIRTASLYVEADNVAAVALYRSFGFTDHSIDIQYELKRR